MNKHAITVGDILQYKGDFGVVLSYNKIDNTFGIKWFDYPNVWWYYEIEMILFIKVHTL
jgi:hypothetical protein